MVRELKSSCVTRAREFNSLYRDLLEMQWTPPRRSRMKFCPLLHCLVLKVVSSNLTSSFLEETLFT